MRYISYFFQKQIFECNMIFILNKHLTLNTRVSIIFLFLYKPNISIMSTRLSTSYPIFILLAKHNMSKEGIINLALEFRQ